MPLNLKNYLNFEPSIGIRETIWYFDKKEYSPEGDKELDRTIYDIKLDLSSDIYKIYSVMGSSIDKVKHNFRPQIVYDYIPEKNQDDLPSFDALDKIEKENLITYSITNTFTSRSKKYDQEKDTSLLENTSPYNYKYKQFCRFKIQQSYDFNKEKEDDPEPFSPILGELDVTPGRYFSIDADAEWSHYDRDFRSRNITLALWDERGDRLVVEHRYKIREQESIYTDLRLKLTNSVTAYAGYERDILEKEDIKRSVGFLYASQCWSLDFRYIDEENDQRYEFMVNLYGIGEIGEGVSTP